MQIPDFVKQQLCLRMLLRMLSACAPGIGYSINPIARSGQDQDPSNETIAGAVPAPPVPVLPVAVPPVPVPLPPAPATAENAEVNAVARSVAEGPCPTWPSRHGG